MAITIHDYVASRIGVKDSYTGQDYADCGVSIIGGCSCGATLAGYNGYPTKGGFWACSDCLHPDDGFDSAEDFQAWIDAQEAADQAKPCRMRTSSLGSQSVCAECGDECECYVCTHDDDPEYFDEDEGEYYVHDDDEFPRGTTIESDQFKGIALVVSEASADMVRAIMVGDDRVHELARDDVRVIDREAFCGQCGQIGCTHDGYERETNG